MSDSGLSAGIQFGTSSSVVNVDTEVEIIQTLAGCRRYAYLLALRPHCCFLVVCWPVLVESGCGCKAAVYKVLTLQWCTGREVAPRACFEGLV